MKEYVTKTRVANGKQLTNYNIEQVRHGDRTNKRRNNKVNNKTYQNQTQEQLYALMK